MLLQPSLSPMSPRNYAAVGGEIYAAAPGQISGMTSNHIYLYSEIDSDSALNITQQLRNIDARLLNDRFQAQLAVDHPLVPIWLHINSPGGSCFDTFSIVDQIQSIQSPVYAMIEGLSASGASIVSIGCDRRFMQRHSYMMIHQLSAWFFGKYEEFKDEEVILDKLMEDLVVFYRKHSKLTKKEIRKLLRHNTWLDSSECLSNGFIDEIIG